MFGTIGAYMKKHKYIMRVFQCPECRRKMYAAKGSAIKTPKRSYKDNVLSILSL